MSFRTLGGVLVSSLIAAVGMFASTFIMGACYLAYYAWADRQQAREYLAGLKAQRRVVDAARRELEAAEPPPELELERPRPRAAPEIAARRNL